MRLVEEPVVPVFAIFSQWFILSAVSDIVCVLCAGRDSRLLYDGQIVSCAVRRGPLTFRPLMERVIIRRSALEHISQAFSLKD